MSLATDALFTPLEREVAEAARAARPELAALAQQVDAAPAAELPARARALYQRAFASGFHRAGVAAAQGGLELPHRARVVLAEELARIDAGLSFVLGACWAVSRSLAFFEAGRPWLESFVKDQAGQVLLAGANAEPDRGSDAIDFRADGNLGCVARPDGEGFTLHGTKWMMTNGGLAAVYLVTAQLEGSKGFTGRVAALVPADARGLGARRIEKAGLKSASHGLLKLESVRVGPGQFLRLAHGGEARERMEVAGLTVLNTESAASACGLALELLEVIAAHAQTRVQGGQPLERHQAVAMRLATLGEAVASARATTWQSAALCDAGAHSLPSACAAKAAALEALSLACREAGAILGATSMSAEHPVARLTRDAQAVAATAGALDVVRLLAQSQARTPSA